MSGFYFKCKQLDSRAKLPKRAAGSAGYDVWPLEHGVIYSEKAASILLGFSAEFAPGWVALCRDKSGTGFKGLMHQAGVIDANYRGEWILRIYNSSESSYAYTPDKAIMQIIFVQVPPEVNAEWVSELSDTERGEGGWGSTGH